MEWLRVENVKIPEWSNEMTIDTIEEKTNGQTLVLGLYYKDGKMQTSGKRLWYTESRDFLMKNGIQPLNEIAQSGKDACLHDKLFWDENLYQRQGSFMGTVSPVLLTKGSDNEITLWGINTVKNLHFRGAACVDSLPKYIRFVRPMYRGQISETALNEFLFGIPPIIPIIPKFEPLPSVEFLKNQIISQGITEWHNHDCSLCGYPCGYRFRVIKNFVHVTYDRGCYCLSSHPDPRNLKDVINQMEIQDNLDIINKYKAFWGI